MNKFRKFLIGITVAAAAGCLCGAVACNNGSGNGGSSTGVVDENAPEYFKLDLTGNGIDVVFEGDLAELDEKDEGFRFGGTVKEGVEVRFKVLVGTNYTGTPVVSLNNVLITPDGDGVYSFPMERDSTIAVTGLSAVHTVTFHKTEEVENENGETVREERRIKFLDEKGKELDEEVRLVAGNDLKFKLWVSPYYRQNTAEEPNNYTVSFGSEVLTPDNDGFYSVSGVSADGEIDVWGLTQQDSFATAEDGTFGDGSAEHPYELRKPIDLFYLAALINDDFYSGRYSAMHYKLMNDIDMQGEQLYVIGDNSTSLSVFSGTFDGNGHKISDFYITDEVYDQSSYTREYLPYVGLFGYVSATVDDGNRIIPPTIKNLTLEDYKIQIHPATAGAGTFAGSLAGWAVGAEIINCKADTGNGYFTVVNDNNQIVNAGGLVGRLQAAYGSTERGIVSHASSISACSADVFLEGTGSPHSLGGLVGYLLSADESAIAYIVNSYSLGSVNGGMHSGGIVGTLGRYSSVANCYSDAQISANNSIEGLIIEEYRGAYAGGIVGYAEDNTVIAGCYSANYTDASHNKLSATSSFGVTYMKTGAFAGDYAKPATPEERAADYVALIDKYNNATAVANPSAATFTALGWTTDNWTFAEGALPGISATQTPRNITVKIMNGASEVASKSVNGYKPLSDWYKQSGGLTEYMTNGQGHRSWGYFFDAAMTDKVPCGFVPTNAETTLYMGYADYSEIEGTYYVEATDYSNGAYIKLNADGTAEIRNGGLSFECTYTYNGAHGGEIIIYNSCLAALSYSENETGGSYFSYGGKVKDGALELSAYLSLVDTTNTSGQTNYVDEYTTLRAVKQSADLVYGEYKDATGVFYLFNRNGTGVMTGRNTTSSFTFTPAADGFVITFERTGNEVTARQIAVTVSADKTVNTVNGVPVSPVDKFKGSWKKTANSVAEFTFDGEGGVTLGGKHVMFDKTDGTAVEFTLDNVTYKAAFSNGKLVINGEDYYVSDGFTGEWFMITKEEQIQIALNGIGTEGYGSAVITYTGGNARTLEAEYDVFTAQDGRHLRIYVGDQAYGDLSLDGESNLAAGSFYSLLYDEFRGYEFNIYDVFRGVWTGSTADFDTVTFNGRSATSGSEVSARTAGNTTNRGTYQLTDSTHGTMTVGGKTYNIVYNEAENRISFTEAQGETPASGLMGKRDGWYGVELTDGTLTYSFDGKSDIGGHINVSDGTSLEYTVDGSGAVNVTGRTFAVAADGSGFTLDDTPLNFDTGFAGDWIVSGKYEGNWLVSGAGEILTIGEVGGHFTADVGGKTYVYNPVDRSLTLTEGETQTVITLTGNNEMSILRTEADGVDDDYNCVRSGHSDSWAGEYVSAKGKWKFDGLGGCVYGSGTAVYAPATGAAEKYSYTINEIGNPYITVTAGLTFESSFTFLEKADGAYSKGGKNYDTADLNVYYGRTVTLVKTVDGEEQRDPRNFFFDGISTVWVKNVGETVYTQKAYSYEAVTSVLCELIDIKSGLRTNGELESVGMVIVMTVTDQLEATMNGVTYAFGVNTVWIKNGTNYTKAYGYSTIDADNKQYEFTDGAGDVYTASVTQNEDKTYSLTVTLKISFEATVGTGDGALTYAFGDGAETLWLKGADGSYTKAYSYRLTNEVDRIYELTDGEENKFTAKVTQKEDGTYTMTITPVQEETEQA